MDQVAEWNWQAEATLAAQANLAMVQATDMAIDKLEQQLRQRVKIQPDYGILRSVLAPIGSELWVPNWVTN